MNSIDRKRLTGEFFTPIEYAAKALEYLGRVLGKRWWESGQYRLWDMASGTGNLERVLPSNFLPHCYVSTLLESDVEHCRQLLPSATIFQYDFLNDDARKLPSTLRAELVDPTLEWLILINPPYAMANNFERRADRLDKSSVSMTEIRKSMTADGLGTTSRELLNQFLYRLDRLFRDRRAILAMFSKTNYIVSPNDQRLRDRFFDYKFEGGFLCPARAFGCRGQFPIAFAIWRFARHVPLTEQTLRFDVFDERRKLIGAKTLVSAPRGELLSSWLVRPHPTKKFPPLSSALHRTPNVKDCRDRIADGFLASLMCNGNDFTHRLKTCLLSAPYVSAGGVSITAENFEQAMVVHAVRQIARASWLNDKDQFFRPTKELPREFIDDCVVWSLFSDSNCTASLKDVEYEGVVYQINNNFYPWRREEVLDWRCSDSSVMNSAMKDTERFVARWLEDRALSSEAQAVIDAARMIYREFYARLSELDREKYRLDMWDVGWYQVRRSLEGARLLDATEFRSAFGRLSEKLLPSIYALGFLRDAVTYFE